MQPLLHKLSREDSKIQQPDREEYKSCGTGKKELAVCRFANEYLRSCFFKSVAHCSRCILRVQVKEPKSIMKISGHKMGKEFLKYIRVSKKETADSLAGDGYFSGE